MINKRLRKKKIAQHLDTLVGPNRVWHDIILPHEEAARRAALTGKIDFRCDFKDGKCVEYRNRIEHRDRKGESRCCCGSCAVTIGFLTKEPISAEQVKAALRLYDHGTGFWREGKGCILPRKHRSFICLRHACDQTAIREVYHLLTYGVLLNPPPARKTKSERLEG